MVKEKAKDWTNVLVTIGVIVVSSFMQFAAMRTQVADLKVEVGRLRVELKQLESRIWQLHSNGVPQQINQDIPAGRDTLPPLLRAGLP